jgi:hypothetical protein
MGWHDPWHRLIIPPEIRSGAYPWHAAHHISAVAAVLCDEVGVEGQAFSLFLGLPFTLPLFLAFVRTCSTFVLDSRGAVTQASWHVPVEGSERCVSAPCGRESSAHLDASCSIDVAPYGLPELAAQLLPFTAHEP